MIYGDYLTTTTNAAYSYNVFYDTNSIVTYGKRPITLYQNHNLPQPVAFFPQEMVDEAMPRPESDLDWLERRVEEICWEPA